MNCVYCDVKAKSMFNKYLCMNHSFICPLYSFLVRNESVTNFRMDIGSLDDYAVECFFEDSKLEMHFLYYGRVKYKHTFNIEPIPIEYIKTFINKDIKSMALRVIESQVLE